MIYHFKYLHWRFYLLLYKTKLNLTGPLHILLKYTDTLKTKAHTNHQPATHKLYYYKTVRYSFNTFMFFFLSKVPSFLATRFFKNRYGLQYWTHLHPKFRFFKIMSWLKPLRLISSAKRRGFSFRRPSVRKRSMFRGFFFKRRLGSFLNAYVGKKYTQYSPDTLFTKSKFTLDQPWQNYFKLAAPLVFENNTLPPIFLSLKRKDNNSFTSKWLWEFRTKTSRFFKVDFKRTAITYNLKPVLTRLDWIIGNRALRFKESGYLKTNPNRHPNHKLSTYYGDSPSNALFKSNRHLKLKYLKSRRILTFWVSKVTQRTLTPARREFNNLFLRKKIRYQYRLTVSILRYYRFKVLEYINVIEFSLINTIMRSRFIINRTVAADFIKKKWFFINGLAVQSPGTFVNPLDIIQLTPSIRWISFFKWHLLKSRETFNRFFYYLRRWRIRSARPYPKQSSFRIPEWVRKKLLYREPSPIYLEVDYLTFSIINLFNPLLMFGNYHYLSINTNAPATIRGLNWKSLT